MTSMKVQLPTLSPLSPRLINDAIHGLTSPCKSHIYSGIVTAFATSEARCPPADHKSEREPKRGARMSEDNAMHFRSYLIRLQGARPPSMCPLPPSVLHQATPATVPRSSGFPATSSPPLDSESRMAYSTTPLRTVILIYSRDPQLQADHTLCGAFAFFTAIV